MLRLASILYSLIGTTLAGSLVVVALVTGNDAAAPIIAAAAIGAALGVPVSWFVARAMINS